MQISVRHVGGSKVKASVGGHEVITDQAPSAGGEGKAPSPFQLFIVSIATCAGYYVFDFCAHRDIPVDDLEVVVVTHKANDRPMVESIDIEIRVPSDFPEKYEKPLIRAAELCSVKKHLMDAPAFNTYTKRVGGAES